MTTHTEKLLRIQSFKVSSYWESGLRYIDLMALMMVWRELIVIIGQEEQECADERLASKIEIALQF
jgi:hypothetical protein